MESSPKGEVTELLNAWRSGDSTAFARLVPLIYDELRLLARKRLRRERQGHTLEPTALVHEAFLRLAGRRMGWQTRTDFFLAAAQAMRRVAVDYGRRRQAQRRGGAPLKVDLTAVADLAVAGPSADLLALDEALTRLQGLDPQQARIVELRFFTGLSIEETAAALGLSPATVWRDWRSAKIWLFQQLSTTA